MKGLKGRGLPKSVLIAPAIALALIAFIPFIFALSDDEIKEYAYKMYPIIKEENITIQPVTMVYVNWAGFYTIDKIQINKVHVFSYIMLDWVIQHELKHHYCWKEYKDIDITHKICF